MSRSDHPPDEEPMNSPAELRRELGVPSATMLGLGSILGTGVFVSIGLVAGLAYAWTPVAIVVAALVAACNALSSAQLAAAYPHSGGTYEYGYRLLHPAAGFTAGWTFLCAKSASAATAALGFAGYLMNVIGRDDPRLQVGVGAVVVVAVTVLVAGGLRRSNLVNTVVVSATVIALAAFVFLGFAKAWSGFDEEIAGAPKPSLRQLLEATALMFVAYTGYGRVATLGEEVHDPARTIPRAIIATLGVSALLYLAVGFVGVASVGSETLFRATEGVGAPLEVVSREFGVPFLPGLLAIGAITAMAGVLLNLLLGLSRVLFAMGRRGDMPGAVTRLDARQSPAVAVAVVGAIILGLTLIGSIRLAWSFSAFTVLIYYALTNLAALRLSKEQRLYPRFLAWAGLGSCAFLAFWVEREIWIVGLGLIAVGLAWHFAARSRRGTGGGRAGS
jgi:APA family basic amino acid/polyamine antiporter